MAVKNTEIWTAIIIFSLVRGSVSYEYNSYERIVRKMSNMAREVYADGETKCRSVDHIKKYFEKSPLYQLAAHIFNIRLKIKFIVALYLRVLDTYTSSSFERQLLWLIQIQRIYSEVDNMVQMVVEYELADPSGRLYGRSGAAIEPDDDEPEERSLLRDRKKKEYLLRKKKEWAMSHGYDINNLTKAQLFGGNKFENGFESK